MSKKVLITGVSGMDGSLMADYLLANTNHTIIAGVRRLSSPNHINIDHLKSNPRFKLIDLDISDPVNVERVIQEEKPSYFINFAANSFVGSSWDMPANHMQTNSLAVLYQLEAIRKHAPFCRYYNAGSSEEFGNVEYSPQDELHPLKPRSPYGASKVSARMLVKVYRESYKLYAIQGWLFNHEGTRRGEEFVTRKISKGVARIKRALDEKKVFEPLELGNLDARRDWSDAEDFMDGVWKMLNQEEHRTDLREIVEANQAYLGYGSHAPKVDVFPRTKILSPYLREYVLASGETHSIREFVEKAFKVIGVEGRWMINSEQDPISETYLGFIDGLPCGELVVVNPKFYRPAEVELLLGNPTKAVEELKWEKKSSFDNLIKKMVLNDLGNILDIPDILL